LNTVPDRFGQTDRQTDRRLTVALPRSALASRDKKQGKNVHKQTQTKKLHCER